MHISEHKEGRRYKAHQTQSHQQTKQKIKHRIGLALKTNPILKILDNISDTGTVCKDRKPLIKPARRVQGVNKSLFNLSMKIDDFDHVVF